MMTAENLKPILEAAIFATGSPLPIKRMLELFPQEEKPSVEAIKTALTDLQKDYLDRGIELKELASGYSFQTKEDLNPWLKNLWQEKPQKYSRAFLETLALIAYRQPISRGEIEDIRGVSVNSQTIKTLLEKEWIRIVGYRDLPGKPALFATTPQFLDHFGLKNLESLPSPLVLEEEGSEIEVQMETEAEAEPTTETEVSMEVETEIKTEAEAGTEIETEKGLETDTEIEVQL